jgi:8-oxo-dGTP pyrophosphatase MutT (NUDIX family)
MLQPARQRPFLAAYCIVRRGGDILVMQRQNTGYADGQWSVPAGHVDESESATAAASRELAEETGLFVAPSNWRLGCAMHRYTPERLCMDLFFVAGPFSGDVVNREPEKCGTLEFRAFDDLPAPFLGYIGSAIRAIAAARWEKIVYLEEGWEAVSG